MKNLKYALSCIIISIGLVSGIQAQNISDQSAKMSNPVPSDSKVAPQQGHKVVKDKVKKVSDEEKNAMINKFYLSRVDFLRDELNEDLHIIEEAKSKVNGFSQKFANQLSDKIITQQVYDNKMALLGKLREQLKTYTEKTMEAQQYLTPVK